MKEMCGTELKWETQGREVVVWRKLRCTVLQKPAMCNIIRHD